MKHGHSFAVGAVLALLATSALAESQTISMASPKCDAEKIQKISGKAVQSVQKAEWEGGYRITLDTTQISAQDLTKKLLDAGCF